MTADVFFLFFYINGPKLSIQNALNFQSFFMQLPIVHCIKVMQHLNNKEKYPSYTVCLSKKNFVICWYSNHRINNFLLFTEDEYKNRFTLFCKNLSYQADEREIMQLFKGVKEVRLVRDRISRKSKGYLILFSNNISFWIACRDGRSQKNWLRNRIRRLRLWFRLPSKFSIPIRLRAHLCHTFTYILSTSYHTYLFQFFPKIQIGIRIR